MRIIVNKLEEENVHDYASLIWWSKGNKVESDVSYEVGEKERRYSEAIFKGQEFEKVIERVVSSKGRPKPKRSVKQVQVVVDDFEYLDDIEDVD